MLQSILKAYTPSRLALKELSDGKLIRPDVDNPEHQSLLHIVKDLSQEFGRDVTVYFVPVTGDDEKERHLSSLKTMSKFSSMPGHNELFIPESAESFYTRGEIEAVLAHEFGHLEHPDLHGKKSMQSQYSKILETWENKMPLRGAKKILQKIGDKNAEFLAENSTDMEVQADQHAIKHGRASDMAAALQKMKIVQYAIYQSVFDVDANMLMEMGDKGLASMTVIDDRIDKIMLERSDKPQPRDHNPHTSESFVERLARLEKAAENEPERPAKGRGE